MTKWNPWFSLTFYKNLITRFIPSLRYAKRACAYGNGNTFFRNFMFSWTSDPSWGYGIGRRKRKRIRARRKFIVFVIISIVIISILALSGCTNQTPAAQAPTYNVTLTDNSQYIVGDNNAADTKATTAAEQTSKPDVKAVADKSGSDLFLFWLGFILGVGASVAGFFVYLKYFKKKDLL